MWSPRVWPWVCFGVGWRDFLFLPLCAHIFHATVFPSASETVFHCSLSACSLVSIHENTVFCNVCVKSIRTWTKSAGAPLSAPRCLNITYVFHIFQTLPTTKYELEIVAKDMAGSEVGLTGTATATITIADKNDHAPEFTHPLVRRVPTFTQIGLRSGLHSHLCLFPILQN